MPCLNYTVFGLNAIGVGEAIQVIATWLASRVSSFCQTNRRYIHPELARLSSSGQCQGRRQSQMCRGRSCPEVKHRVLRESSADTEVPKGSTFSIRCVVVLFISQRLCRIDSCNSQSWHSGSDDRYRCEHQDDCEDCGHVIDAYSIEHTVHSPQCSCT